jgi:mRNA interferase RelE/StbE
MYTITISQSALKELYKLQKQAVKKIEKSINALSENPRPVGVKKLKGNNEDLYRIRSGDYRVVYAIDDGIRIVDVRKIGHRKDIYK